MSCLLSKDLDVASLKNCMWETTSARPLGLYRKYYTRGNSVGGTPKKVSLDRPNADNGLYQCVSTIIIAGVGIIEQLTIS